MQQWLLKSLVHNQHLDTNERKKKVNVIWVFEWSIWQNGTLNLICVHHQLNGPWVNRISVNIDGKEKLKFATIYVFNDSFIGLKLNNAHEMGISSELKISHFSDFHDAFFYSFNGKRNEKVKRERKSIWKEEEQNRKNKLCTSECGCQIEYFDTASTGELAKYHFQIV